MRHPDLLDNRRSLLLVVDIQEGFRHYITDFEKLASKIALLTSGAKLIEIPVIVSEQYPKGLGKTVSEVTACLPEHSRFEKTVFSCGRVDNLLTCLNDSGRKQIIVCGIEAHVCINQTVHDLIASGFSVHVVLDAIGSREPKNMDIAVQKMLSAGAHPSSVEQALFELLEDAGHSKFKAVQALVK